MVTGAGPSTGREVPPLDPCARALRPAHRHATSAPRRHPWRPAFAFLGSSRMANFVTIEAEARAQAGKGAARATRRAGKVPGVIYGAQQEPTLIALEPRAVLRELHRPGWQSRLYEITVDGDATRALIRDVQFHPVTDAAGACRFPAPGRRRAHPRGGAGAFRERGHQPGAEARRRAQRRAPRGRGLPATRTHIPEQFTADLGALDFNDNVRWHDLQRHRGRAPGDHRP